METNDGHTLTSIHKSILDLHVAHAGSHQKLVDVASQLENHITEEHEEFRQALAKINDVERAVNEIHTVAKFTRIVAVIATSLAGAFAWSWDWIKK